MGIDDFAIKKRHTYGTAMVNLDTRKIIDLVPSRDISYLIEWLKNYKNLKLVSRDGSIIYKNAIEMTDNTIIQVSDRFHLIKLLSEAISDEINSILPSRIVVEKIAEKHDQIVRLSIRDRYFIVKKNIEDGVPISIACKNNKIDIRLFKRLINLNDKQFEEYFLTNNQVLSEVHRKQKLALIKEVRELYQKGVSCRNISKCLGISRNTASSYLNDDYVNAITMSNKSRNTHNQCDEYRDLIIDDYKNKVKQKNIYCKITNQGFKGTYGSLRMYIQTLKRRNAFSRDIYVTRSTIKKLIYNLSRNVTNHIEKKHLLLIYQRYPMIKSLIELMWRFKGSLLKNKSEKSLIRCLEIIEMLDLQSLNSFKSGVFRDYDAIINSMKYSYNNGILESKVNKIKLAKRIMYGRCSFQLLKCKVLGLEI